MIALAALLAYSTTLQDKPQLSYKETQEQWRAEYAKSMERPMGWLSVAGLFWLKDGPNAIGADPSDPVVLPAYVSPAQAGTMTLHDGKVTLSPLPGVTMQLNAQPLTADAELKSDADGKADLVTMGEVNFKIIKRGDRMAVRLYDPHCKGRMEHQGFHWYPVNEKMKVEAQFVPYDPPKSVLIKDIIGNTTPVDVPGYLVFKIGNTECRLDAQDEGDTYFLNFTDKTTGKTTYGAGRFLDIDKPVDGKAIIDFNQAYNPPCAYTAFATCPLPPAQNRMKVEIKAGEKDYHKH